MFESLFRRDVGSAPKLLLLGAHSDDIEIGAGGTVLRLLRRYPDASVHWVVFSADQQRASEAKASADLFLGAALEREVVIKDFRDGYFPFDGAEIKDQFELLKSRIDPDLIFTHSHEDAHQDHRTICSFTWNTFRQQAILEYEIPKWDGDLGRPNLYVPLNQDACEEKLGYIMESFQSQRKRNWFTEDTFWSLLRLRGVESQHKYAEAFYSRKLVIRPEE